MKNCNVVGFAGVCLLLSGCSAAARRETDQFSADFEDSPPGRVPTGWRITATNPTAPMAEWAVRAADGAGVSKLFALTRSQNYDGTYNLAIAEQAHFADLELSVRVRADAGKEDQGGGPIWRVQDENNYYISRFNPLEGNFRVYVVSGGKRRQLETVKLELAAGRWYELRIRMVGDEITCWLDGTPHLHARDSTITKPGCIGLWTKADAVTSFDDLQVRALRTPAVDDGAPPPR
ncbi:hypothetical protein RAS1_21060 [Phycisphaerae bacterium RAS1]|nr:hypothetical protein RAS1_21060 [Phycisphaerae bacterium RAS1]